MLSEKAYIVFSIIESSLLTISILILFIKTGPKMRPLILTTPFFLSVFFGWWYVNEYTYIFSTADVSWSGSGYWIQLIIYLPALTLCLPIAVLADCIGIKGGHTVLIASGLWVSFLYSLLLSTLVKKSMTEMVLPISAPPSARP